MPSNTAAGPSTKNCNAIDLHDIPRVLRTFNPPMPTDLIKQIETYLPISAHTKKSLRAITSLRPEEILEELNLTYSVDYQDYDQYIWDIPGLVAQNLTNEERELVSIANPHLGRWIFLYQIVVRHSEAACRMPVDQALLEAIAVVNGLAQIHADADAQLGTLGTDLNYRDRRVYLNKQVQRRTPIPSTLIKLYTETNLCVSPTLPTQPTTVPMPTYTGRVDYAVGIQIPRRPHLHGHITNKPRNINLVLVGEAKGNTSFTKAIYHCIGYAGILRLSRLAAKKRRDCTTYGLASDGFLWAFIKVDHQGHVRVSKQMDLRESGWQDVLAALIVVIKEAMKLQTAENTLIKTRGEGDGSDDVMEDLADDDTMSPAMEYTEMSASEDEYDD